MKKLRLNKLFLKLIVVILLLTNCDKKTEIITYVFIHNESSYPIKIFFYKNGKETLKYEISPRGNHIRETYPGKWNFDFFHSQADSIKVVYNDSISIIHHKNDTITSLLDPCNWLKTEYEGTSQRNYYQNYYYDFIFKQNDYKEALSVQ